jgi:thiol-disulfide isomerase/thioredoxin
VLQGLAALGVLGSPVPRAALARTKGLRVGAPAPPARLVTLDGRNIATSDLAGQVVILTFWATWCVPCRSELPLLSDYYTQHSAQGLAVLAFSLDLPEELQRVARAAQGLRFPVGLLGNSSAPGYGRIWRLPVNFTIDRAGLLADDGWQDPQPVWTPERLARIVSPLL